MIYQHICILSSLFITDMNAEIENEIFKRSYKINIKVKCINLFFFFEYLNIAVNNYRLLFSINAMNSFF